MKTFTQAQVLEITMVIVKGIAEHADLDQDELEEYALSVNKAVIKGLQMAGADLPWIQNIRKN
jgi:hypothetical protein